VWARARALGLDVARLDEDRRGAAAAARVQRDTREALAAGAMTTPTVFIGERAYPGVPPDEELLRLGYDGWVRFPKASKDAGVPNEGRAQPKDNFI
jgi:predicted DsbA family dithiol-disulfide isomerase